MDADERDPDTMDPDTADPAIPRRRARPLLRVAVLGAVVAAAVALVLAAAPLVAPAVSPPPVQPVEPVALFVDPDSPAARQARQWSADGRAEDARRIGVIAAQPMPEWLTSPTAVVGAEVTSYVERATAAGQRPIFVAYHIPGRDCGSFSGGGAVDSADYRAWIRAVAGGLKGHSAIVVLEPDAVPHELTGCTRAQVEERYLMLADAVAVLKAAGPVTVYLDAGNPGFVTDIDALAVALRLSGMDRADGFSLNVANFYPTAEVVDYGRRLSKALGGAHFVVDTGRNGNGRADGDTVDGGPAFCNPPGRAIGQVPTTDTGDPVVDAYLWIKRVGESDGACRPGEPAAGQWWPEYALGLVPPG